MAVVEKGFEGLAVWQRARELMIAMHQDLVPLLPPEEKWDLAQQVRRSSKTVLANIAEGYGRYYFQDNVRFCYLARGSLDETASHLRTALDLGYIPQEMHDRLRGLADEVRRMLSGHIAFLKRRRQGDGKPGSQATARELRATYSLDDCVLDDLATEEPIDPDTR